MAKTYKITDLFKTTWAELTTDEIAYVIEHRGKYLHAREQGWHGAAGHHAIMILRTIRKNKALVAKINVEQAVDCINDMSFMHQPWYFFPEVGGYQPAAYLKNHTFIQLFYMDSLFSQYHVQDYRDRNALPTLHPSVMAHAFLDEMIGVIYTPPAEFDEARVEEHGKRMSDILTDAQRMVILHAYGNVKEFIIGNCPLLFPQHEEEVTTVKKPPAETEPMWKQLLFDLSETPAYQGIANAKRAPMYEALDYLEKKHKELLDLKSKNPNAKM
jgi:hypothetical protein